MGGCRCSFRNCPNSSYNSKDNHFFHYPIKDKKRCTEWILHSNNPAFATLPKIKLKNKVVCDQHFSSNSFMNYRRDRLVHNAVPRINSTNTNSKTIVEITEISLFDEKDKAACNDFTLPATNTDDTKLTVTDIGTSGLLFSENKVNGITDSANIISYTNKVSNVETIYLDEDSDESNNIIKNFEIPTTLIANDKIKDIKNKNFKRNVKMTNDTNTFLHNVEKNEYIQQTQKFKSTREQIQVCQNVMKPNNLQINKPLKNINKVDPPKQVPNKLSRITLQSKSNNLPSLTKDQLFQGIRKYLSTSMEVLLRMELFGSPDREWNADEKELSMEFLNFGSDVYSYMTDELRWRLPSSTLVSKWKVEEEEDDPLFNTSEI